MAEFLRKLPDSVLSTIAIGVPPPGTISNFVDPPNSGWGFIIVGAVLLPIMGIFMAIRADSKLRIIRKTTWDDCRQSNVYLHARKLTAYSNLSDSRSRINFFVKRSEH